MEARVAVITVSDTRTAATDASGPAVVAALRQAEYETFETQIVPDEQEAIATAIHEAATRCRVVLTTGGTGFAPRDLTPEATAPLLERRADSLAELIRLKGMEKTPLAHLSRGLAGTLGTCLIVNLPGSPKGAREGIEALLPLLPHILEQLSEGGGH